MTEYWVMAGARDCNPISRHRTAWGAIQAARKWEKENRRLRAHIFRSKPIGRQRWSPTCLGPEGRYLVGNTTFVSNELGYAPKRMT